MRPHPPARGVVERPVHHQRLVRLAVAGHAEHLVLAALVVAVQAEGRVGQRWKLVDGQLPEIDRIND